MFAPEQFDCAQVAGLGQYAGDGACQRLVPLSAAPLPPGRTTSYGRPERAEISVLNGAPT